MKNFIHHIVLTVSDCKKSADFYQKALGWGIGEKGHDYMNLVPDKSRYPEPNFLLVLAEPRENLPEGKSFDKNRIGLDHFAFQVDSRDELEECEQRLRDQGIDMEDGGITDDDFGGAAIFCKDPDGMKLEIHLK